MGKLISDHIGVFFQSPIVSGFALVTFLAVLLVGLLIVVVGFRVPVKRLILTCLAAGIPITALLFMKRAGDATFAVNLCLADLVVGPAVLFVVYELLKRNKPIRLPLFWLFLSYGLWAILSLYVGCWKLGIEFLQAGNLFNLAKFITLFIYFYLVVNLVEEMEDLEVFLKTWVWISMIAGLTGIGGALFYMLFKVGTFATGQFRAMGVMTNPNMFAGYMAASFFFTYVYRVLGGKRWICSTAMIVQVTSIVLSASKGGAFGFLAGCTVLLVFMPRQRVKALAIGAGTLATIAVVYLASEPSRMYVDRILSIKDVESRSHQRRFELWMNSLRVWEDNYLFGVGRGNLSKAYPEFESLETGNYKWAVLGMQGAKKDRLVSHSTYLSLLCEMGLPGLVGFLVILLYFVRLLLQRLFALNLSSRSSRIQASLLAALIGVMAHAVVANTENSRALWALLGIIFACDLSMFRTAQIDPGYIFSLKKERYVGIGAKQVS